MKLKSTGTFVLSTLFVASSLLVLANPAVAKGVFASGEERGGRGGINCTGILSGRAVEESTLMPGMREDFDSLVGLSEVEVQVYQLVSKTSSTHCVYTASSSSQCWVEAASVSVDLAGYYVVAGLPLTASSLLSLPTGTFKVYFEPTDGCHVGEFYNDSDTFSAATSVTLTSLLSSLILDTAQLEVSSGCRSQQ